LDACHKSQQNRRISHRKILLEARGNECQICGYNRSKRALAFHHIDEKTKKFTLATAICQYKWAEVVWEASKCLLVCANCHAEIHDGLHTELLVALGIALVVNQTKFIETVLGTTTRKKERRCSCCDCEFVSVSGQQKFCSTECSFKAHRKVERPTKQDLQEMLWTMPTSQIAVRFGVSDKAVSKWATQYELSKPGRGYWQQKHRVDPEFT
jgi:hypothetical protein